MLSNDDPIGAWRLFFHIALRMFRHREFSEDVASAAYSHWLKHGCPPTKYVRSLVIEGVRNLVGRPGQTIPSPIDYVEHVPDVTCVIDYEGHVEVRRVLPTMRDALTQEEIDSILGQFMREGSPFDSNAARMRDVRIRKSGRAKLAATLTGRAPG